MEMGELAFLTKGTAGPDRLIKKLKPKESKKFLLLKLRFNHLRDLLHEVEYPLLKSGKGNPQRSRRSGMKKDSGLTSPRKQNSLDA